MAFWIRWSRLLGTVARAFLVGFLAGNATGADASPAPLAPSPGMLLVASDRMADARFQETVILIIHYDATGVAGLILNRPLGSALGGRLPALEGTPGEEMPLFIGGPLQREPMVLLKSEAAPQEATRILPGLFLTGLPQLKARLAKGDPAEGARIFLGYSGWEPSQLAAEIDRGYWEVLPGDPASVLTADPATLWRKLRGDRSWI